MAQILVVDDDDSFRRVLQAEIEQGGYSTVVASSAEEALSTLQARPVDLVITDLRMPGMSGLHLLKAIRSLNAEIPIVILTAFATVDTAVEAMKAGAYDYTTKPVHPDELLLLLGRALEHVRLIEEVRILRANLNRKYGFENILGRSDALLNTLDMAARAARTNSTVLISGESGTGKELLARAIHFNSSRKDKAIVTINCGAIPKELLESELFGHKKGSFTGAVANKRGRVESADGGTLFLDEIGELPIDLQVKLLRLLQNAEIETVGSSGPSKVDIRVIAATNRDLQAMIEDGNFREDLYYRLAVIPLIIPPLRERPDDIPELVQHFFQRTCRTKGRPELVLPASILPFFTHYRWPGNIRELENVIERIVVLTRGDEVKVTDLPDFLQRARERRDELQIDLPDSGISLESVERELIVKALEKCGWNQTHAARYLNISRKTLLYRIERHGIHRPDRLPPQ